MISPHLVSQDAGTALSGPARLLIANPAADLTGQFDHRPFIINHSLQFNPLFQLPALIELEQSLKHNIYYDAGNVGVDDRWDTLARGEQTAKQALESIEQGKTWLVIKNAQQSPKYAEVLEQCLEEAEALVSFPLRRGIRSQEMIIFVTSPRRIATYHIDRECSFLLQVQGQKTIHIFDRNDRDLLPEEEIEAFWTIDNNAPRYRPQFQDRAQSYLLEPGKAVHIPVNFPHWVENHDNVSVSVNINVQFKDSMRADIYRANYFLRRLGFSPSTPSRHRPVDHAKAKLYATVRGAMRLCGRRLP
ncbi:MAG: cupin-like domain-containing protein [Bryobacteraceae bacterium]